MDLHVQRWGEKWTAGPACPWQRHERRDDLIEQRPLAERWSLLIVDRRGYYPTRRDREDFDVDAIDIAELLGDGAHLVGYSYGRSGVTTGGSREAGGSRSLTVIEPPAFAVADNDPEVRSLHAGSREFWEHGPRDPEVFLGEFLKMAGSTAPAASPLPAHYCRMRRF